MTKPAIDLDWALKIAERKRFFKIWSGASLRRPEPDPRRLTTAWHEGGHLAAGVIVGAEIGGAHIRAGHWHNGEAHVGLAVNRDSLEAAWWQVVGGELIAPDFRDLVERNVLIYLAGGVTEAVAEQRGIIGPRPPVDNAAPEHRPRYIAALVSGEPKPLGDSDEVDELLRWLCGDADEQSHYRAVLMSRTEAMVRSNPRFWPLAERFAVELINRDELSAMDIAALIAQVEENPAT